MQFYVILPFSFMIRSPTTRKSYSLAYCHNSNSCKLYRFHPTKLHLEGGNYSADELLILNGLRTAVILIMNTLTDTEVGTSCTCSLVKYRSTRTGNENHVRVLLYVATVKMSSPPTDGTHTHARTHERTHPHTDSHLRPLVQTHKLSHT